MINDSRHLPRNHPLRKLVYGSVEQVSWLPGCLLAYLPVVTHSGLMSFRTRYSCGNSVLPALPLSTDNSKKSAHHIGNPQTLSTTNHRNILVQARGVPL